MSKRFNPQDSRPGRELWSNRKLFADRVGRHRGGNVLHVIRALII